MAHVAVTTTLPVMDCLWLEKMNTKRERPSTQTVASPHNQALRLLLSTPCKINQYLHNWKPHSKHSRLILLRIPPQKSAPEGQFSKGQLHCTVQTPVLACRLRYFAIFRRLAVELVHAGLTSPPRRSLPEIEANPQSVRRLVALVHKRPTCPPRLSPRRLSVALVRAGPTCPPAVSSRN